MTENDNKTTPSHNGTRKTPNSPTEVFTLDEQLKKQLIAMLILVNFLLLGSILALFIKLGWMALLAVFAVF